MSATAVQTDGPIVRGINAMVETLVASERKVALAILADRESIMYRSVTDIAAAAGTSNSTVVRASVSLGFAGFHDLKVALAREAYTVVPRSRATLNENSTAGDILSTVLSDGENALSDARQSIDLDSFARSVELIDSARRVLVVGVGTSAPLAQDAGYRFTTIGIDAQAPADAHLQHVQARLLTPSDLCLAISHTGATQETLAAVRGAHEAGAPTIAISSFARSPLSELADETLVAGSGELSYRIEAMASRLAHLSVVDALFVAVAIKRPERADQAQARTASVLSAHRF